MEREGGLPSLLLGNSSRRRSVTSKQGSASLKLIENRGDKRVSMTSFVLPSIQNKQPLPLPDATRARLAQ